MRFITKSLEWLWLKSLDYSDLTWSDIHDINRQIGCLPDKTDVMIMQDIEATQKARWIAYKARWANR